MEVGISSGLLRRIIALAADDPGREVCGLLLGSGGRIEDILPAANVAVDPAIAFEIDPTVHFAALRRERAGGAGIVGHYHSHPRGPAVPSPRDSAAAHGDGALWLVVGAGGATLWRASAGGFEPVSLIAEDAAGLHGRRAAAKVKAERSGAVNR